MGGLPKVLCVDDEESVLLGLSRLLREYFKVETASSGEEALDMIAGDEFSVIVSDMRMPFMDGATFLSKAKELSPDSTRILLTGQADLESTISAINNGNVFRLLIKPCSPDDLVSNIMEGVRINQLIKSERDLLENTLKGAINVLVEALSIISPNAFSRSSRIKNYVVHMAGSTNQQSIWEFEVAAMLSQLGAIVLPPKLIDKIFGEHTLGAEELSILKSTSLAGRRLIEIIPRLEDVAEMIGYQFATESKLKDDLLSEKVIVGARMLGIANAVDNLVMRERISVQEAAIIVGDAFTSVCDQELILSLASFLPDGNRHSCKSLSIVELRPGMVLDQDILSANGAKILFKGQKLSLPLIDRLVHFANELGVEEPIAVLDNKKPQELG